MANKRVLGVFTLNCLQTGHWVRVDYHIVMDWAHVLVIVQCQTDGCSLSCKDGAVTWQSFGHLAARCLTILEMAVDDCRCPHSLVHFGAISVDFIMWSLCFTKLIELSLGFLSGDHAFTYSFNEVVSLGIIVMRWFHEVEISAMYSYTPIGLNQFLNVGVDQWPLASGSISCLRVSFASWSTLSFPSMPQWLGIQQKRTCVPISLSNQGRFMIWQIKGFAVSSPSIAWNRTLSKSRQLHSDGLGPCVGNSSAPDWWLWPHLRRWCCYLAVFWTAGNRSHHSGNGGWWPLLPPLSRSFWSHQCRLQHVVLSLGFLSGDHAFTYSLNKAVSLGIIIVCSWWKVGCPQGADQIGIDLCRGHGFAYFQTNGRGRGLGHASSPIWPLCTGWTLGWRRMHLSVLVFDAVPYTIHL